MENTIKKELADLENKKITPLKDSLDKHITDEPDLIRNVVSNMLQTKTNDVDFTAHRNEFKAHKTQVDTVHKEFKDFKTFISDALSKETRLVSDTMDKKIDVIKKKLSDIFDEVETVKNNYQQDYKDLQKQINSTSVTATTNFNTTHDSLNNLTQKVEKQIQNIHVVILSLQDKLSIMMDRIDRIETKI